MTDVELGVDRCRVVALQIHVRVVRCAVGAATLQRGRRDRQVVRRADLTVRVGDRTGRRNFHVAVRIRDIADRAAAVVQGVALNMQRCAAELTALCVADRRRADRHLAVAGDRAHEPVCTSRRTRRCRFPFSPDTARLRTPPSPDIQFSNHFLRPDATFAFKTPVCQMRHAPYLDSLRPTGFDGGRRPTANPAERIRDNEQSAAKRRPRRRPRSKRS